MATSGLIMTTTGDNLLYLLCLTNIGTIPTGIGNIACTDYGRASAAPTVKEKVSEKGGIEIFLLIL